MPKFDSERKCMLKVNKNYPKMYKNDCISKSFYDIAKFNKSKIKSNLKTKI